MLPVTISQPFYLGKYPVMQAQWEAVMGNNPSEFKGNPNRPVENVLWDDVLAFSTDLGETHTTWTHRSDKESEWRAWFLSEVTRRC
jgi:formylglycine-generating enzyme required for sulfatase activity